MGGDDTQREIDDLIETGQRGKVERNAFLEKLGDQLAEKPDEDIPSLEPIHSLKWSRRRSAWIIRNLADGRGVREVRCEDLERAADEEKDPASSSSYSTLRFALT